MYTLESLRQENPPKTWLNQKDVDKVNFLIAKLSEARQDQPTPKDGDKIIFIARGNVETACGYLEHRPGQWNFPSICKFPSGIYVGMLSDGSRLTTNASGGDWVNYKDESDFLAHAEYDGEDEQSFWTWGRWGSGADHGIYFRAKVNLWKVRAH